MARRNYRKSSKKIQPSVMTLNFLIEPKGSDREKFFIDLSQCVSIVNRRFYRQGLNWAVSGFKFLSDASATGELQVQKLPNTWVMSNSWEKGFRAWQKMNEHALQESPSVRPKFLDFKVYADSDHQDSGFGNNLLPYSAATIGSVISIATPGEWESSKVVIPSQTTNTVSTFEITAVGANTTASLSLIEGYAASRGLPNIEDPNTPDDAGDPSQNWLTSMFSDGTAQDDTVIDDMISENNIAPYPFENGANQAGGVFTDTQYPGGANQLSSLQIHDQEFITGTTVGGTTRIKGGNFPCGLVCVGTAKYTGELLLLQIDLVPGMHRGYLAEPMTDM